jgi:hypothetical protein
VVRRGQPGLVLVDAACRPGDLVVGAGRRGALAPIVHGRVSRYCQAHARCLVLTVPPLPGSGRHDVCRKLPMDLPMGNLGNPRCGSSAAAASDTSTCPP